MGDADSKNTEPNEFGGLIGTFTKYGTLLVGGLCLLMYSNEIGQFPEGMGLGEGLAFYLVCAGFLIAYSLYTAICTATGCLLLAWPARALHRTLVRRETLGRKRIGQMLLRTDFSAMWELPVVALGIVGLICHGIFIYYSSQPVQAALFFAVPLAQGAGMVFLLVVTRRKQHLESGVMLPEYSERSIMIKRRDVGQKVVIELPNASGVSRLSIPSDSIYVE